MAKFLLEASYTTEGVRGLQKDGGSGRRIAVDKTVQNLGGKLEAFYYVFGNRDAILIVDLPDAQTAAALSLAISATGAVQCSVSVLLTAEDIDAAVEKTVDYKAPGK